MVRPGKNITGLTTINVELSAKRLELLRTAVDGLTRVAVLINVASPQASFLRRETETAAASLGLQLQFLDVRRAEDVPRAFASIAPGVGALLILPDPILGGGEARARIVDLSLKRRLPTMERDRGFAEAGGLMSYGTNLAEHYRQSARHVDSILRGAQPSSLPVEQPTTYELTVNVRTARVLGLKIPPTILTQADRVLE
jgi:putative ABC transport system substrate-binding protein